MDLGAYAQINILDEIAKLNDIYVPRLRGYRLMQVEKPININEELNGIDVDVAKDVLEAQWYPNSNCRTSSVWTDWLKKHYLHYHYDESGTYKIYDSIRWDRIHGKHRKTLKFAIKQKKKRIIEQYKMFNMYAGRSDVLYIHSRIGGENWLFCGGPELTKNPWFLDKVDDAYDRTYCDIYAKISKFPEGLEYEEWRSENETGD